MLSQSSFIENNGNKSTELLNIYSQNDVDIGVAYKTEEKGVQKIPGKCRCCDFAGDVILKLKDLPSNVS